MNRKTGIIVIIVFLLVAIAILGWMFYSPGGFPFGSGKVSDSGSKDLFPFGDEKDTGGAKKDSENPDATPPVSDTTPLPVLREISLVPVSGAHAYFDEEHEVTYVRFLERSTGHIFETTAAINNTTRITNTTIPKVQNVAWNKNGSAAILQYQSDSYEGGISNAIVSFYGEVASASTTSSVAPQGETTLEGVFLAGNITALASSPDSEQIFMLEKDTSGVVGYIANIDGSSKKQVFESALTEWQVTWPEEKTITLTSNASAKTRGYSYALDAKTGKTTPLITNKNGLTTLMNHDGSKILYSEEKKDVGTTLGVYTPKDNTYVDISLKTLPEKCAWGNANVNIIYCGVPKSTFIGTQPDDWYQGILPFNDTIWSIDATTGAVEMVVDLESIAGKGIDVIQPFLDTNDTFLFFMNKNDLHLWSLKIGI